ncbi:hypothetical protein AHAS_Ahas14G0150300 [Arachis hypogaea]
MLYPNLIKVGGDYDLRSEVRRKVKPRAATFGRQTKKSLCILHSLCQSILVDTAITQHGMGDEATIKEIISEVNTNNVLKFLMESNSVNALHGQDCAVSLLFAWLPVLGGTSGVLQGVHTFVETRQMLGNSFEMVSLISPTTSRAPLMLYLS